MDQAAAGAVAIKTSAISTDGTGDRCGLVLWYLMLHIIILDVAAEKKSIIGLLAEEKVCIIGMVAKDGGILRRRAKDIVLIGASRQQHPKASGCGSIFLICCPEDES